MLAGGLTRKARRALARPPPLAWPDWLLGVGDDGIVQTTIPVIRLLEHKSNQVLTCSCGCAPIVGAKSSMGSARLATE